MADGLTDYKKNWTGGVLTCTGLEPKIAREIVVDREEPWIECNFQYNGFCAYPSRVSVYCCGGSEGKRPNAKLCPLRQGAVLVRMEGVK